MTGVEANRSVRVAEKFRVSANFGSAVAVQHPPTISADAERQIDRVAGGANERVGLASALPKVDLVLAGRLFDATRPRRGIRRKSALCHARLPSVIHFDNRDTTCCNQLDGKTRAPLSVDSTTRTWFSTHWEKTRTTVRVQVYL